MHPVERVLRLDERLGVLGGLLGAGTLAAVSPFPYLQMRDPAYRAMIFPPPKKGPAMRSATQTASDGLLIMSTICALCWAAGLVYALTLWRRPDGGKILSVGGVVCALVILVIALVRYKAWLNR